METIKKLKENVFSAKLTVYEFNKLLTSGGNIKFVLTDGDRAVQREIQITIDEKENLNVVTKEEVDKIIGLLMSGYSVWDVERETNRSSEVINRIFKEFSK